MEMDSIKSVMVSFYDGAEFLAAKELLFKYVDELKLDGAPRCVSRWKSDDQKSKLDAEDIHPPQCFSVTERRTGRQTDDSIMAIVDHTACSTVG